MIGGTERKQQKMQETHAWPVVTTYVHSVRIPKRVARMHAVEEVLHVGETVLIHVPIRTDVQIRVAGMCNLQLRLLDTNALCIAGRGAQSTCAGAKKA